MSFEKGNKKVINAWCWYDWANSVYPLVITTAVFPIYFSAVTSADGLDTITVLGKAINNNEFYSYLISLSFVLVAMISPVLSGIADYAGKKRTFMQIFSTMGAIGALSLFFFFGAFALEPPILSALAICEFLMLIFKFFGNDLCPLLLNLFNNCVCHVECETRYTVY